MNQHKISWMNKILQFINPTLQQISPQSAHKPTIFFLYLPTFFPVQVECEIIYLRCGDIIINKIVQMDEYFQQELNMYLIENSQEREQLRKASISLQKSNDNMQTYKTKMNSQAKCASAKGKYIDKLKNFTQNHQSYAVSQLEEGCSLHSLSKRERNRISAKQSRDRKKLYIELMEHEQKKLQQQLEEVGREIEQTKNKIGQFCSQNKANLGFATRSQLQGKLERILASANQSASLEDEINILLDCISFRIGGTGRDRINKQNYCYKQIINLSLPALHRYLMWAATENKHVFNLGNNYQEFPCPLLERTKELEEQKETMERVKGQVIEMKKKLIQLIEKLWVAKGKTEDAIKTLEDELDQMREILLPSQVAKFILFASRNKYRKDLNFFEEDRQLKEKQEIEVISRPSKRVKKEQTSL